MCSFLIILSHTSGANGASNLVSSGLTRKHLQFKVALSIKASRTALLESSGEMRVVLARWFPVFPCKSLPRPELVAMFPAWACHDKCWHGSLVENHDTDQLAPFCL